MASCSEHKSVPFGPNPLVSPCVVLVTCIRLVAAALRCTAPTITSKIAVSATYRTSWLENRRTLNLWTDFKDARSIGVSSYGCPGPRYREGFFPGLLAFYLQNRKRWEKGDRKLLDF